MWLLGLIVGSAILVSVAKLQPHQEGKHRGQSYGVAARSLLEAGFTSAFRRCARVYRDPARTALTPRSHRADFENPSRRLVLENPQDVWLLSDSPLRLRQRSALQALGMQTLECAFAADADSPHDPSLTPRVYDVTGQPLGANGLCGSRWAENTQGRSVGPGLRADVATFPASEATGGYMIEHHF